MPRVLIADSLSPAAATVFAERGIEADVRTGLAPAELAAVIGAYDGLAVRSATRASAELMAVAPRLRIIGRAGIGVDNIDVPAATARGVVVMNAPYGNAVTTAEHAVALMMALARRIPQANASTHAGRWERTRFMGTELYGKTLGVVGCGAIGALVVERARGLRMLPIASDPYLSPARAEELAVEKVAFEELLQRSDIITLHAPLTAQTRSLIDAAALARTRPGVRIINCARGGLVVEADLKAALESGHVAGAALDVFEREPATESPLFGMDNVVCTPHLGASTAEAQENVARQIAGQMSDFLTTGAVAHAVNMPSLSAEDAPRLRPYMDLAEQLGSLAGQISDGGIETVTVACEGQAAEFNTRPLAAAALKGLLQPQLETVNLISAPVLARQRGIDVTETHHPRQVDYLGMIRVDVTTEIRTSSVRGTLFAGDRPRLVGIEGVSLEAELGPHMLFLTNDDAPGQIGRVGTILGAAGVNIASFHLGRDRAGGLAVALLQVDAEVPPEAVAEVRALPRVGRVRTLAF